MSNTINRKKKVTVQAMDESLLNERFGFDDFISKIESEIDAELLDEADADSFIDSTELDGEIDELVMEISSHEGAGAHGKQVATEDEPGSEVNFESTKMSSNHAEKTSPAEALKLENSAEELQAFITKIEAILASGEPSMVALAERLSEIAKTAHLETESTIPGEPVVLVESDAVGEPETVGESHAVGEPEISAVKSEPAAESEPVAESEYSAKSESIAVQEPVAEPEPAAKPEVPADSLEADSLELENNAEELQAFIAKVEGLIYGADGNAHLHSMSELAMRLQQIADQSVAQKLDENPELSLDNSAANSTAVLMDGPIAELAAVSGAETVAESAATAEATPAAATAEGMSAKKQGFWRRIKKRYIAGVIAAELVIGFCLSNNIVLTVELQNQLERQAQNALEAASQISHDLLPVIPSGSKQLETYTQDRINKAWVDSIRNAAANLEYVQEERSEDIENSDTYKLVQGAYTWDGAVLSKGRGTVTGPNGKETYYNLNMSVIVSMMHSRGVNDTYWVRSDGCKMIGNYVMVAADLGLHPRGSIVKTSKGLAMVCDTGSFTKTNRNQIDIAVTW